MSELKEFEIVYYFSNGHKIYFKEQYVDEESAAADFGKDLIKSIKTKGNHFTFNMKEVSLIGVKPASRAVASPKNIW